ncbi:sorting nexin-15 [Xenopus tropicalis]|uniref:Sorting nexin-15 n=1 Tax=Xenopus tropicalis TaxID=8364 RepID=A4IIB7_XENTR|eukprot:NP_001093667.1 sorting nexin-15 [Xenopus tropicalis]
MSRGSREQTQYERRYNVTDTRTNPKGFTEYKVTAQFISKKNPQDVKEVLVWKRYSDFKKLHGELSYTHRNLFQRCQEFPPFPRAQVFGRFEAPVIEERRQAAEDMLKFTVNIPALYNSPQLKDFFREGEVSQQAEGQDSFDALVLPTPLTPEPVRCCSPEDLEEATDCSATVVPTEVTKPVEDPVIDEPSQIDLLFDLCEEHEDDIVAQDRITCTRQQSLTHNDLALFDPCFAEGPPSVESHLNLLSLGDEQIVETAALFTNEEQGAYISQATEDVQRAMEKEAAGDYPEAFRLYRSAVDTLLKGVKDDPCEDRRNAVTRRTAEYLSHAENILNEHMSGSAE